MIKAVIVINTSGRPRLVRFYEPVDSDHKTEIISKIFKSCSKRGEHCCNFIDDPSLFGADVRVVFRQYATLYIIFAIDSAENELGILDLIQVIHHQGICRSP